MIYKELLEYGNGILKNRFNEAPYKLLDKLSDDFELYQLKIELSENGFKGGLVIAEDNLNQAYELMRGDNNETHFVLHTINYIAMRNPFIKNALIDFLKGC